MLEVSYRPRAELDLQSIVLYASEVLKTPATARDAYEKIRAAIARLREFPTMGRIFRDDLLEAEYRCVLAYEARHR